MRTIESTSFSVGAHSPGVAVGASVGVGSIASVSSVVAAERGSVSGTVVVSSCGVSGSVSVVAGSSVVVLVTISVVGAGVVMGGVAVGA